jgi:hypothetical protein
LIGGRRGPGLRLALWTGGLAILARVLLAAGSPRLDVPLRSPGELPSWVSETPPADMAVALLRVAALAATGYLLVATVLAVVARLVRVRGLGALVDRVSPEVVRRLAAGGGGVGLAVGAAIGSLPPPGQASAPVAAAPVAAARADGPSAVPGRVVSPSRAPDTSAGGDAQPRADPDAVATMTRIDDPQPSEPASATMTRLDPGAPVPTSLDVAPSPGMPPAVTAGPAGYGPEPDDATDRSTWLVEAGDSFWSIAEEVMAPPDGGQPDDRQVDRYWRHLIEANRSQLVDPANPDLLVPGQHLVVPPPST